jgi:hypothetical protein
MEVVKFLLGSALNPANASPIPSLAWANRGPPGVQTVVVHGHWAVREAGGDPSSIKFTIDNTLGKT